MNQEEPSTAIGRQFGDAVRDARSRAGISQRRLSELIDEKTGAKLYPSAVTRIETGQREPKLSEAVAIARALGMSLSELVDNPADHTTRFDHAISMLPVRLQETDESLKQLVAQIDSMATLLEEHPELLDKMRFADDRQPGSAREWLEQVADGFRQVSDRQRAGQLSSKFHAEILDILTGLASRLVRDAEA